MYGMSSSVDSIGCLFEWKIRFSLIGCVSGVISVFSVYVSIFAMRFMSLSLRFLFSSLVSSCFSFVVSIITPSFFIPLTSGSSLMPMFAYGIFISGFLMSASIVLVIAIVSVIGMMMFVSGGGLTNGAYCDAMRSISSMYEVYAIGWNIVLRVLYILSSFLLIVTVSSSMSLLNV